MGPVIHGNEAILRHWLSHYWQKLNIPERELSLLAMTQDRHEFRHWTTKRLNPMALGCYCYIPASALSPRLRTAIPIEHTLNHRHIIFIEPGLQPKSIEVTVAHELIHLADRVQGTPRRHRHHGHDAIAADEAAVTGHSLEELRVLLREESAQLERRRREIRPIRYHYQCPNCQMTYPRTRRYSHPVSCSGCDKEYNPLYTLVLLQADA